MNEAAIRAAAQQLFALRMYLNEAVRMGEVFRTDGDRSAIRSLAYQIDAVEQILISMLPPEQVEPLKPEVGEQERPY